MSDWINQHTNFKRNPLRKTPQVRATEPIIYKCQVLLKFKVSHPECILHQLKTLNEAVWKANQHAVQ